MQNAFVYNSNPNRVIFGFGTRDRLAEEADRLGIKKAIVLATSNQKEDAKMLSSLLGNRVAAEYHGATMHTPVDITNQAIEIVKKNNVDGIISIGGGSSTGLGKALALRTDFPQIVLPTTYAGSEMTPILGETENGEKKTISSHKVLPEVVIYDVELTLTLPVALSGTSGINAIAHAVEALYARDKNPITDLLAIEAISSLSKALPIIANDPNNAEARAGALYGAWLCGTCLGSVGMSIHHKLCHTLGGLFNLPHAETHTVILPHALAYNASSIPDVMKQINNCLKSNDSALSLYELAGEIGAPRSLKELGMIETNISLAVERALANPYWNPRPLIKEDILQLITRAYFGEPPFAK